MLTPETTRSFVRDQLGFGAIEVELKNEHIDAAIKEATGLINAYAPVEHWDLLNATQGGRFVYVDALPDDPVSPSAAYIAAKTAARVVPGFQRIVEIIGVRNNTFNGQLDLFDPLLYLAGGINSAQGLSQYTNAIMYLKQARKVLSADVEWRGQRKYDEILNVPVYELYVSIPATAAISQQFGVRMFRQLTPDDNPRTGIAYITPSREFWFNQYVLARCKVILATIRGKFGGIPSVMGEQMTLDQHEMATEGNDEIKDLRAEIVGAITTFGPILA